jgi:hypothetical protein
VHDFIAKNAGGRNLVNQRVAIMRNIDVGSAALRLTIR